MHARRNTLIAVSGLTLLLTSAHADARKTRPGPQPRAAKHDARKAAVPTVRGKAAAKRQRSTGRPNESLARRLRSKRKSPMKPKALESLLANKVDVTRWADLTPRTPDTTGKAALVLVGPEVVDGGMAYVDFADHCVRGKGWWIRNDRRWRKGDVETCPPPGYAVVWVHSPGSTGFAVDCDVAAVEGNADDAFTLTAGTAATAVKLPASGHLVFKFDTDEAGWHPVTIEATHDRWRLFGCSIRRML